MTQLKQYLRIDEVAKILRIHKNTVRNYIEEGRIKAIFLNPGKKGIRVIAANRSQSIRRNWREQ